MNSLNALWLEIDPARYKELNEPFVVVEGKFEAEHNDHVGRWSGTIRDVTKVLKLPRRSKL